MKNQISDRDIANLVKAINDLNKSRNDSSPKRSEKSTLEKVLFGDPALSKTIKKYTYLVRNLFVITVFGYCAFIIFKIFGELK